jgi:hypothetical protein
MRDSRHTTRRLFAALACLVWILGFEVVPNVHVGMHELFGHHHHGVGGHEHERVAAVEREQHEHDDADHHHDHGDADHHHDHGDVLDVDLHATASQANQAACESMQEHGRHSLAHRDIAATPPPWALADVAIAPFVLLDSPRTLVAEPFDRQPQAVRARGPPALT